MLRGPDVSESGALLALRRKRGRRTSAKAQQLCQGGPSSAGHNRFSFGAFCLDVRTLTFCQFSIRPLKVKLSAGEQKTTQFQPVDLEP